MTPVIRNGVLPLLLIFLILPTHAASPRDPLLPQIGITQNLGAQLPASAPFLDHTGNTVRLGDYFTGRRPIILTLVYYECPMLCTVELNELTAALNAMSDRSPGQDYDILTVSFDPNETPALAARKREQYLRVCHRPGAADHWHFLTGSADSIKQLTDAAGFRFAPDPIRDPLHPNQQQYLHAGGVMILTPTGKVSRYFFGLNFAPKDMRLALADAAREKQGSITNAILLFCFHYDPASGRYTLAILNLIKAGAAITLATFLFFWLRSFYRERRALQLTPREAN